VSDDHVTFGAVNSEYAARPCGSAAARRRRVQRRCSGSGRRQPDWRRQRLRPRIDSSGPLI